MAKDPVGLATNSLIRLASMKFHFLVTGHGFRREDDVARWGTSVTFHGELWSLYLFYGNREFDFLADIKKLGLPVFVKPSPAAPSAGNSRAGSIESMPVRSRSV